MAAYMRPVDHRCQRCNRFATVEVFNTVNASMGYYCTPCGKAEVQRLNREIPRAVTAEGRERR